MNDLDLLIAKAQRSITYLYWFLFAVSLGGLLFLPKPIDDSIKTLLLMMLGALITLITQQSSFWFARQRAAGVPDPTTTTTSTTTTTTPSLGASNVETTTTIPARPAADSVGSP